MSGCVSEFKRGFQMQLEGASGHVWRSGVSQPDLIICGSPYPWGFQEFYAIGFKIMQS